ncbi:hypothetical protein RQP46_000488 [Phenoliferia psychrophenolica]
MLSNGVCNPAIRVGGFGPMIQGGTHQYLTSCFNDVVLLPLPTWLLILIGVPILAMSARSNRGMVVRASLVSRIFTWVYHLLILAALLMSILEIVRLALSDSGIGLLPFTLAGILIAMGMLVLRRKGTRKPRVVGGILAAYWGLLIAFQSVKVDTLVWVENMAKAAGSKGPAMYPNSDKSLDNYVILGLYVVLFLYEVVHLVTPQRQSRAPVNAASDEELVGNAGMAERK